MARQAHPHPTTTTQACLTTSIRQLTNPPLWLVSGAEGRREEERREEKDLKKEIDRR